MAGKALNLIGLNKVLCHYPNRLVITYVRISNHRQSRRIWTSGSFLFLLLLLVLFAILLLGTGSGDGFPFSFSAFQIACRSRHVYSPSRHLLSKRYIMKIGVWFHAKAVTQQKKCLDRRQSL